MELVTPTATALGLVPAHDANLLRHLQSSCRLRVLTTWESEEGRPVLTLCSLSQGPEACLNDAAEAVRQSMAPAPLDRLGEALSIIVAVCIRPSDLDDAKMVLWTQRMLRVLGEYPADVALASIDAWPKSQGGRYWPNEHDLRAELDQRALFRTRLLRELDIAIRASMALPAPAAELKQYAPDPEGKCAEIVSAWRQRDERRANVWISDLRFAEGEILFRSMAARMALENAVSDIIKQSGVSLVANRPEHDALWQS